MWESKDERFSKIENKHKLQQITVSSNVSIWLIIINFGCHMQQTL